MCIVFWKLSEGAVQGIEEYEETENWKDSSQNKRHYDCHQKSRVIRDGWRRYCETSIIISNLRHHFTSLVWPMCLTHLKAGIRHSAWNHSRVSPVIHLGYWPLRLATPVSHLRAHSVGRPAKCWDSFWRDKIQALDGQMLVKETQEGGKPKILRATMVACQCRRGWAKLPSWWTHWNEPGSSRL